MGRLRKGSETMSWLTPSRCLIGRSRFCQLRVNTPETSGEHALLRWRRGIWELQDLHSRNGTYVDEHRLPGGQAVSLVEGARLSFGGLESVVLVDAGPPKAHAVGLDLPLTTVEAQDGFLALPDSDEPEVVVRHHDYQWWLERADGVSPVDDGAIISTRSGRWRLHLPELLPSTCDAEGVAPTLAGLALRFFVREDGDIIELVVSHGDNRLDIKTRAHHAPLLALARARLVQRGRASEEMGWVEQDELVRLLECDVSRLHVDIHRLRRQFAAAGVVNAANIVERCQDSHKLRLAISDVKITTLP